MVFGANTYRAFEGMLASSTEDSDVRDPWVTRMWNMPATLVSTTLLEHMERSPSRLRPHYGLHATDIRIASTVDPADTSAYPVTVTVAHQKGFQETGEFSTIRAKYVVGADGSRSGVRTAIGRELVGDPMNQSWGVLDALVTTDFPDIRRKCAIHSANDGNILIIPREGGYLVRIYIELDNVRDGEMLKNRSATPEKLAEVANRILAPYTIDVKDVGWWAVYEIGQRVTDKFDDVPAAEMDTRLPRVFIAGDACHTHSAKAGQGMNVSMNDTWNLGWKLASVLRGRAKPELLHTYSDERQKIAKQLIDFDRDAATPTLKKAPGSGPSCAPPTLPSASCSPSPPWPPCSPGTDWAPGCPASCSRPATTSAPP